MTAASEIEEAATEGRCSAWGVAYWSPEEGARKLPQEPPWVTSAEIGGRRLPLKPPRLEKKPLKATRSPHPCGPGRADLAAFCSPVMSTP